LNLPNRITLLRIITSPLVFYFLFADLPIIAAALFTALILTDAVDGYIARKFDLKTTWGKIFDPLADKVLILGILICLIEVRDLTSLPVIVLVFRDLIVMGQRIFLAEKGIVVPASLLGKIKTVIQTAAVLFLILSLPYGVELLWLSVLLSIVSGVEYLRKVGTRE
jgi:CDP-diacylglycerol--glycerol-3-phosphate 3-phosphatidyltransferase